MSDVNNNDPWLDDTQIFDVLRVAFNHIRDHAPLHLLCYLGLDPWMRKDLVSCQFHNDKTALDRAKSP